jgi:hypothetical protein
VCGDVFEGGTGERERALTDGIEVIDLGGAIQGAETLTTPCPVAGRNKPAILVCRKPSRW